MPKRKNGGRIQRRRGGQAKEDDAKDGRGGRVERVEVGDGAKGEGVEERVSGAGISRCWCDGVVIQPGSPHPNLHSQRGARNCHSSGRPVEDVWKQLSGEVFTEALERNVDTTSPLE